MMYSPRPMNGRDKNGQEPDIERIEQQLLELEKLAEELEGAPEAQVVNVLDRAVTLLVEVNAGIESALLSAENEARELGDVLKEVDFGPFDAALEDLEQPPESSRGT